MNIDGKPLEDILKDAEDIYDGWFADSLRVDWQEFIDRLESRTDVDFGSDMGSPLINSVKKHILAYRKL